MAAFVVDRDVLTGLVTGDVIVPDGPDYDIVRKTAMARFDHIYTKSEFLRRSLDHQTIMALADNLARDAASVCNGEVAFMPWGGAYNQVPSDATAFPHRNERFLVQHLVETDRMHPKLSTKAAAGFHDPGPSCIHSPQVVCIRTSRIRISRTGVAPITANTTADSGSSRPRTTRTISSAFLSRYPRPVDAQLT
jgi:hypothetical protein